VTRVSFSADDVARTRFHTAPAPLVETGLALAQLRRAAVHRAVPEAANGWRHGAWRDQWWVTACRSFPASARPLLDLIPSHGLWPEFLDPVTSDFDEGLELVRAAPASRIRAELAATWRAPTTPPAWLRRLAEGDREAMETVVRALRDFYLACVAPRWTYVLASFRRDLASRSQTLIDGGFAALLSGLHPQLAWRRGGLERSAGTGEYSLKGGGLQLIPSAFWGGSPLFAFQPPELGGNHLIYPAMLIAAGANGRPASTGTLHLAGVPKVLAGPSNLAALIGGTRAEALRELAQPASTGELAARLRISASSASEHVKALRRAGLAVTERQGRSVRHSLTPLGRSLLQSCLAAN
jgi:DNA-binding transcriptional ArsR family regulator